MQRSKEAKISPGKECFDATVHLPNGIAVKSSAWMAADRPTSFNRHHGSNETFLRHAQIHAAYLSVYNRNNPTYAILTETKSSLTKLKLRGMFNGKYRE